MKFLDYLVDIWQFESFQETFQANHPWNPVHFSRPWRSKSPVSWHCDRLVNFVRSQRASLLASLGGSPNSRCRLDAFTWIFGDFGLFSRHMSTWVLVNPTHRIFIGFSNIAEAWRKASSFKRLWFWTSSIYHLKVKHVKTIKRGLSWLCW